MNGLIQVTDPFLDALRVELAPVFERQKQERAEHNPAALARCADAGITIDSMGGNCPVQIEGLIDGQPFYFRARGDSWALHVGPKEDWFTDREWLHEADYGDGPFDAGWMPEHEALGFVCDAVALWPELRGRRVPTLPNVHLGVSVEDQAAADERVPQLLATPAAVRFLSCEPLIGPVDLLLGGAFQHVDTAYWGAYFARLQGRERPSPRSRDAARGWADGEFTARHHPELEKPGEGIGWVIAGGESGRNARPMHPDWARSLRDQCAAAGVPFFFKQWGEWRPVEAPTAPSTGARLLACEGFIAQRVGKRNAGRLLDGRTHQELPV